MTKIFIILLIMFNGELIETQELPGHESATMEMCQKAVIRYETLKLPEGYTITASCEERQSEV